MLYDALLILWRGRDISENEEHIDDKGDEETYRRICDIAAIYKPIHDFNVANTIQAERYNDICPRSNSLYKQALSEGITEVLQPYKDTLLKVESLLLKNQSYTLFLLYSHVEKYIGLFMCLNKIIKNIKDRESSGCQIMSVVYQHILNSNEMIHEAVLKLFKAVNKVFINQLCSWLLYGELKDPFQEFFIIKNGNETILITSNSVLNCDKSLATKIQENSQNCGFSLNINMIPHFVPLSLAQEILFIGKTVILFDFDPRGMKKGICNIANRPIISLERPGADMKRLTIWGDREASFHEKLHNLKSFEAFEMYNLKMVVSEIKECVTKHLWWVAVEEAQLAHELQLMKDFYLLGRGELFLELLRLTSYMLDKPTTRTSTRDMNHAFTLAARSVLLSNNSDVDKFSFELPYVKPNVSTDASTEEDTSRVTDGWSNLILKYDCKWPLHLLFTPEVLARYNDMFRLLLRIKKTQHDLHVLWMTYKRSTNFAMCQLHNKLMFLMDNLQHYLQADVLETNFARFMEAFHKTEDFEKLKMAHADFLADILSQSFLTISPIKEENSTAFIESFNNPIICKIMELLQLCQSFCAISDTALDKESEDYYVTGYSERFNKLVKQLMQMLVSVRERPSGIHLARLLMRLDFNRWLSQEAQLTRSVISMLQ